MLINYLFVRIIEKFDSKKLLLFFALINIAILSFSKFNKSLLVGQSFITFALISVMVDNYRQKGKIRFSDYANYILLFPKIIMGPIIRFSEVEKARESIENRDFIIGLKRFVIGMGKKIIIADNLALLVADVNSLEKGSVVSLWIGSIAFSLQLYFDFSGYSDMAIGLLGVLGYDVSENFNYPYMSKSFTEFWRRWHISLGTWFKNYVYIPLGGSRRGTLRTIINLFIVWILTGLWHGFNLNFVIWGVLFFLLLSLEKTLLDHGKKVSIFN